MTALKRGMNTMVIEKSPNAVKAENKGYFMADDVTPELLEQHGFQYEKEFFVWLCKKYYIKPLEYHHGKKSKNGKALLIEPYYNENTISFVTEHFDLEFLYRYYQGKITYQEALVEKDIHFCRVRAVSDLIGIRKGEPVTSYCIRQGKTLWFSKKKYIKVEDAKTVILDEWDVQPNNFSNPNTKKIINTLCSMKKRRVVRTAVSL